MIPFAGLCVGGLNCVVLLVRLGAVQLVTNLSDQKLLVTIVTNLDTNLKNKELLVTKIVTIINKNL